MTRRDVEKHTGLRRSTIQFYLDTFRGLIEFDTVPAPGGRAFEFTSKSVSQFNDIIRYRENGFSLSTIKKILSGTIRVEFKNA